MLTLAAILRIPDRFALRNAVVHALPEFSAAAGDGWLDRILAERLTDKLHEKQGRSIARWTLPRADGTKLMIFLKRHYRLSRWSGLLARLFPRSAWSPGLQEWQHLQWAQSQGLPVPKPLAAAEWRGPGLMLQSFLAVEELAGMLPLNEAIPLAHRVLSTHQFEQWKRRVIRELARLAAELHRRRAFHKDLYLCHFYIAGQDCRNVPPTLRDRLVMIDLHRLGRHRLQARYFQVKDIAQLLYSTVDLPGLSDRDRLRFWKHYRPIAPSWIRRAVLWKYRLYLRHARRKANR